MAFLEFKEDAIRYLGRSFSLDRVDHGNGLR
jgi:hypothetical protein